jgi:hypothetical protein
MQYFYINQNSTLNSLRCELINDGRYDYLKSYRFNNAIQNADVTFSMTNVDNCRIKISKSPATIVLVDQDTCDERYILEYKWQKRDVNDKGIFDGKFEIVFRGDLKEENITYDDGNLIVPIYEDLRICIK